MDNFIITTDPGAALTFKEQGFTLAGQDGTCWYFLNDQELLAKNKKAFAKVKYTTTNKIVFDSWLGYQYK